MRYASLRFERLDPTLRLADALIQTGHLLGGHNAAAASRGFQLALGGMQQRAEFAHVEQRRGALQGMDRAEGALHRVHWPDAAVEIEQRLADALGKLAPFRQEIGQQIVAHDVAGRW